MTLTSALNTAMTGLAAAGRASQVASSNIANALTEGYARRETVLVSDGATPGVRVAGTLRHSDPAILADRRSADAGQAHADAVAGFHDSLERLVGLPGEAGSLTGRLTAFESALDLAASRPDQPVRLDTAAEAAAALAQTFNRISDSIQGERIAADDSIAAMVEEINDALSRVERLNGQVVRARTTGADPSGLLDERQRLVDRIAEIVPVREVARENGQIALYSQGGAMLLDGRVAEFGFTAAGAVDAESSVAAGGLSGLMLNGRAVRTDAEGPLGGGAIAARFEIRDRLAPAAQARLDAVAADLIARFQSPGPDATLAPGAPGLFTDAGAPLDPAAPAGLAGRLSLNALIDADGAGESWRLRDGLGAAEEGEPGASATLERLRATLADPRPASLDGAAPRPRSAAGLIAELTERVSTDRVGAEAELISASAMQSELKQLELAGGVDSDAELQALMLVEQAFAANARVLQAVDEMMTRLLNI